jgi:hypothetical protein
MKINYNFISRVSLLLFFCTTSLGLLADTKATILDEWPSFEEIRERIDVAEKENRIDSDKAKKFTNFLDLFKTKTKIL